MPKNVSPTAYTGQLATTQRAGLVRKATDAEAAAATVTDAYLSPSQGTASVPAASTTVAGKVELATSAETVTGTDSTRAVTSAGVTAKMAAPGAIGGTTPAAGTFTAVTATTGDVTATLGDIVSSAGSVSAATTVTATLGDVTATNGDLSLGTAGNKLKITEGANASMGVSGALSGTPGTITISTTAVTANSRIFLTRASAAGTLGNLTVASIVAGNSFDITSDANETSTVNWLIIN